MTDETTTKRDLPGTDGPATMADTDGAVPKESLAKRLNADRLKRRMTWPAYAQFLGVKLSTVYKIATEKTTKPHELTVAQIEERIQLPVSPAATTAEGAADAVVSSGQRHPERSED